MCSGVNLHEFVVYLVYGRDKTFDMQSINASRSFKAYKFFDGFVRNVWVLHSWLFTRGTTFVDVFNLP